MADILPRSAGMRWAGTLLGFALGGFFDGILLHQILQWHHLLSLVDGVGDLRAQLLFDGLFHALMYVIAVIGLLLLWKGRAGLAAPRAGKVLLGRVLAGFGAWHVVDGVLSHWVLGIHRIRIDSPDPLMWDLIWLLGFGILPLLAGLRIQRGGGSGGGMSGGRGTGVAIVAAILVAASWSARPPAEAATLVIFRPDMRDGAAWSAIRAADGDVLWHARGVWAVRWRAGPRIGQLYGGGALMVGTSAIGAGCLAWSQA